MRLIMKVVFEFPVVYRNYACSGSQEHTSRSAFAAAGTIILTYLWHSISPYQCPSAVCPRLLGAPWGSQNFRLVVRLSGDQPAASVGQTPVLRLQHLWSLRLMGMIRSSVDSQLLRHRPSHLGLG